MSESVEWVEARTDEPAPTIGATAMPVLVTPPPGRPSLGQSCATSGSCQKQTIHSFPARMVVANVDELEWEEEEDWDRHPDLWLYRRKTTALLRRYMQWSLAAGRVPSLLGRELFRAKISAYTATTFEARVIFLHDVERCLGRLQGFDGQIIARIVLQEYDHEAAARILQCDRKTIERRLPELIDLLSEAFLKAELIERLPETVEEAL
jgi:DNA-directed RNA polymerase specialized sigma24 family protein